MPKNQIVIPIIWKNGMKPKMINAKKRNGSLVDEYINSSAFSEPCLRTNEITKIKLSNVKYITVEYSYNFHNSGLIIVTVNS